MMAYRQSSEVKTIGWLLENWLTNSERLAPAMQTVITADLVLDSRRLTSGDLFIALPGEQYDGADYIDEAIAKGAIAVLLPSVSTEFTYQWRQGIPLIFMPNLAQHLSAIAVRFYDDPSTKIPVIGVTGTNGKTTCVHLLAQLFAFSGHSCGTVGTLGCDIYPANGDQRLSTGKANTTNLISPLTTPDELTIQAKMREMVNAGVEIIALEASSHGLVQGRIAAVDVNTAVFTNLTRDHLDYHGDMESYGKAKSMLFTMPSVNSAVINIDDAFGRQLVTQLSNSLSVVTYSLDDSSAHFYLTHVELEGKGVSAMLHSPYGAISFRSQLLGEFNLSNLLAAFAVFTTNSDKLQQITAYASRLKPVAGRMEYIANNAGIDVVVDFAHTPDALKKALAAISPHCTGQLWCIFGCGGNRDSSKRPLMAAAAERSADKIIVTSDNPRNESPAVIIEDICAGFSPSADYQIIQDRRLAIGAAIEQMQSRDLLLIAGKGHENYQQIGDKKLPFSDQLQARMALRLREQRGQFAYE